MKSLERILLSVGGVLILSSCGSDKTASGGTGSDFPIHPAIAIVQDKNRNTVAASSWRLWSVGRDSIRHDRELSTTDSGFLLPDTGSWIVEAWGGPQGGGKTSDLSTLPIDPHFERCLNWIGRNTSSPNPAKAVLGTCAEITSPTMRSHGASQAAPRAVAAFRLPSPRASASLVRDSVGRLAEARVWRLWKATGGTTGPLAIYRFAGFQSGGEPGTLETAGLTGTWVAQGWLSSPTDSLFRSPAFEAALESALLDRCLGSASSVPPKLCNAELFEPSQYGNGPGQLPVPTAQVVFRIP